MKIEEKEKARKLRKDGFSMGINAFGENVRLKRFYKKSF